MVSKDKNMFKIAFVLSYFFVPIFLAEEFIRLHELNNTLVIVFFFQNIALFSSMLFVKHK